MFFDTVKNIMLDQHWFALVSHRGNDLNKQNKFFGTSSYYKQFVGNVHVTYLFDYYFFWSETSILKGSS